MTPSVPAGGSRACLSSNEIKLIAFFAMTLDHLVWLFFPGCQHIWWVMLLHSVGRITAPVMWFFIAEGFHYTHDRKKYCGRLFLFAIISHFAYNFAGGIPFLPRGIFNQTSVMWSLAWSVVLMEVLTGSRPQWFKTAAIIFVCIVTFPSDWSSVAAMCPVFLYLHRGNFKKQSLDILIWTAFYAAVYFFALDPLYGLLQFSTLLSLPILWLYDGTRGRVKGMKWFFYLYYPAHLIVIGLLRLLLDRPPLFP